MIPKVIHYCWFGRKEKPQSVIDYINTWKEFLPDFEIKEWNEDNYDVSALSYTKEAYYAKKFAFVSDVARLYALYNEGGIYLDTDIRFIKEFNIEYLECSSVFSIENDKYIATSFMASEKNGTMVKAFLNVYSDIHFFNRYKYDLCPNTARFTELLESKGIKLQNEIIKAPDYVIFPQEYFSAKDYITGEYMITDQTYCIHDFSSSWIEQDKSIIHRLVTRLYMLFTILTYSFKFR